MMKFINKITALLFAGFLTLLFSSCSDWVNNIDQPIDDVAEDELNIPQDIPFLVKGVQAAWVIVWDETSCFADGLSDGMGFTRDIQDATYPTFEALDMAEVTGINPLLPQNNSTEAIMYELARFRLYADTLVTRIRERIKFSNTSDDQKNRKEGLYTGFFYGALARYIWGAYWALNPNDGGGGVINLSPYIPATQMYSDAVALLDSAILYATPNQQRIAYTFKARILLIQGQYYQAKIAAEQGFQNGDNPLSALYNKTQINYWNYWAGAGRVQFYADNRYNAYRMEDSKEAARIPLGQVFGESGTRYYRQDKYNQDTSAIKFLSWQENYLMLAELDIRNNNYQTALDYINEIRESYGIDDMTEEIVTTKFAGDWLEMIYVERDKELCFTGMRLIDQRRFNKWHLDPNNTWQWFPISNDERNANPNLH